jgi:crossover junction endodeoxyribonuclease RuvC
MKWSKSNVVMGLDPSLAGFAMASLKRGDDLADIVELSSKSAGQQLRPRLARYEGFIEEILEHASERKPSIILIEGYSFASSGSVISLAEFGILLRRALLAFTDVVEVPPSVLKKFATGKGNANKAKVVSALSARYGIRFDSDNEADAFGLLQIAILLKGWEQPSTKYQKEALQKLKEKGSKRDN